MQSRSDTIDALRGLAIGLVLLNHVNMRLFLAKFPYWESLPATVRNALVWNGQNGVQIFFAISGFLITSMTLRRWGALAAISPREFYALRFARIAPLLLLLLGILSLLHVTGVPGFVVAHDTGGLGRALFAALTFHVNWLEATRGYLPGSWDILWSLSVEEVFYLCFPVFCRALGSGKLLLVLLGALIALGPVARTLLSAGNEVWRETSYLGGMDAIAMGCGAALLTARSRPGARTCAWLLALGATGMAFVLSISSGPLQGLGLDMSLLAFSACLVIIAAAEASGGGAMVRVIGAPLRRLGRRSYEIYLTHMFVVMGLFHVFTRLGMPRPAVTWLFVLVILLAAILGELTARYVSDPMNRWLRELSGARTPGWFAPDPRSFRRSDDRP